MHQTFLKSGLALPFCEPSRIGKLFWEYLEETFAYVLAVQCVQNDFSMAIVKTSGTVVVCPHRWVKYSSINQ